MAVFLPTPDTPKNDTALSWLVQSRWSTKNTSTPSSLKTEPVEKFMHVIFDLLLVISTRRATKAPATTSHIKVQETKDAFVCEDVDGVAC